MKNENLLVGAAGIAAAILLFKKKKTESVGAIDTEIYPYWRKLTYMSSDNIKLQEDMIGYGNYKKDVEAAKKYLKSKGYTFIYLSKTKYDTFGESIKD